MIFFRFDYFTGKIYFDFYRLWGKGKAIKKFRTAISDFDNIFLANAIGKFRTAII